MINFTEDKMSNQAFIIDAVNKFVKEAKIKIFRDITTNFSVSIKKINTIKTEDINETCIIIPPLELLNKAEDKASFYKNYYKSFITEIEKALKIIEIEKEKKKNPSSKKSSKKSLSTPSKPKTTHIQKKP